METIAPDLQVIDEIDWSDLTRDVHKKRCVLFLGPSLPVYELEGEKVDFYSMAALYLSARLLQHEVRFDKTESKNLYYIAQKYLSFKKNNRIRLEDEIAELYAATAQQLKKGTAEGVPPLYKTIMQLPWHTIVNMQPDNFFETMLNPNEVFAFYHYKPNKDAELKLDKDQFLVYNLHGAMVKENTDYKIGSLILTEEDQVEFVRNLVRGTPRVPEGVISRFDDDKIFIFLDCNLENWHFRLLMEMLKIHKDSHTYSPKRMSYNFPPTIVDFFRSRYGFIFINNNSDEFINKLSAEYGKRYAETAPAAHKKILIAYDDSDEELMRSLLMQFRPWIDKKILTVLTKEDIPFGKKIPEAEREQFEAADGIMLIISAQFLNEPTHSRYVLPALAYASAEHQPKKVFAIIKSACPWQETPINNLPQKQILPANRIPIRLQQQEDPDRILYEIVHSITRTLWE